MVYTIFISIYYGKVIVVIEKLFKKGLYKNRKGHKLEVSKHLTVVIKII